VAEFGVSLVVYLCVMCGAFVGIYLHRVLPPDHVKADTREIVNLATGLLATLAALVLGLMVASAKSSFDARSEEVRETGARIIMLDRSLRQYGPQAQGARELLRQLSARKARSDRRRRRSRRFEAGSLPSRPATICRNGRTLAR